MLDGDINPSTGVIKKISSLADLDWFHGNISRSTAESVLINNATEGTYLLRISSDNSDNFFFSVRCNNSVKHIPINKSGQLFVLGITEFYSFKELLDYFKSGPVLRCGDKKVVLKKPYKVKNNEPHSFTPGTRHRDRQRCGTPSEISFNLPNLSPLLESSFNEPNNQKSQKLFMKFFYESKAPITDDIKASIEKQEWEILINEKTTRYEVIYQEYFLDCFISEKKMWRLIVTKNILTKDEINLIIKCSTNICEAIFYCSFEMEGWKPSETIEWLTIDIHISLISKKDFNTFYPWISVCEGLSLFLHDEIDYIEEIYRHIQDQSSLQEFFIEYRGKIFVSSKN